MEKRQKFNGFRRGLERKILETSYKSNIEDCRQIYDDKLFGGGKKNWNIFACLQDSVNRVTEVRGKHVLEFEDISILYDVHHPYLL